MSLRQRRMLRGTVVVSTWLNRIYAYTTAGVGAVARNASSALVSNRDFVAGASRFPGQNMLGRGS